MPILNSLSGLLVNALSDIADAERQFAETLPWLVQGAHHPHLRNALLRHLGKTKGQASRLGEAFGLLETSPTENSCQAMQGLLAEALKAIALDAPDAVRDVGLVGAARCISHYELAVYGMARAMAEATGEEAVSSLLEDTLEEEWALNEELGRIAADLNELAFPHAQTALLHG